MARSRTAPFEPGRLKERIEIRRAQDVQTAAGGYNRGWAPVPGLESIPAEVIGLGGREAMFANTLQGTATYRITIRYREGIQANDQILWRGQELNILAPPTDPTGRRRILQIMADSSAPQNV